MSYKNHYLQQTYPQAFAAIKSVVNELAFEPRDLGAELEKYTYEQFKEEMKSWLVSGRCTWLITGNLSDQQALGIVEKARKSLDLSTPELDELQGVRIISLKEGTAQRIQCPLSDKTNDNNCVLSYFETGVATDDRADLLNQLMMQYISSPFFNDLRTKQQLGYVVFSRHVNSRDTLGCEFLVQSSKYSCEYLVSCINKFLTSMIEEVLKMTDDEFETQINAVYTSIGQKDKNLIEETTRYLDEISSHTYNFDRQADQVEALKLITKPELIANFDRLLDPKHTRRIDLELTSEAFSNEQDEYFNLNKESPQFKGIERTDYGSLASFREQAEYT